MIVKIYLLFKNPWRNLSIYPFHNYRNKIFLFCWRKFVVLGNFVPFFNTVAAAGGGCVLSNKNRMPSHWGLFAIICRFCRSNSIPNKIAGMRVNLIKSFVQEGFLVIVDSSKKARKYQLNQELEQKLNF